MAQINIKNMMSVIEEGLQVRNFDFAKLLKFQWEVYTFLKWLHEGVKSLTSSFPRNNAGL